MKITVFLFIYFIGAAFGESTFPMDESLKKRMNFWKKIYTEISTNEGFLHDEDDLSIVYTKIKFGEISEKSKINKIKEEKKRWGEVFNSILKNKKIQLSKEEAEIYERIKRFPHKKLKEMAREIRFQLGLSDRYLHGLEESYKYLDEIKDEFKTLGLPAELAYLPHVESSFNYKAYSKVGAAGIWQFMRPTARLYKLKQDYLVDERRDPLRSTEAAAKLLRDNYKRFKSWPLAITAYNAGANGLANAIIKTGSRDLSVIFEKYGRGRFGFASKNFYATFLAAQEISENPQLYFKNIQKRSHPPFQIIKIPERTKISQLAKNYKINSEDLEDYNLALRPIVFKRDLFIPKGYLLKLPSSALLTNPVQIAEAPKSKKRAISSVKENNEIYKIQVEPDETLGHYADWSLIPQEKILEINKMPKTMYVGKEILLPLDGANLERFKKKRSQYHARIQKSFFNKYKVEGVSSYEVKKGDTLEKVMGKLDVPLWLIKKYQKNVKLNKLKVGDTLEIPQIVSVNDALKSRSTPSQ
jgi:membrane-bound lytic murein transglycosylase D